MRALGLFFLGSREGYGERIPGTGIIQGSNNHDFNILEQFTAQRFSSVKFLAWIVDKDNQRDFFLGTTNIPLGGKTMKKQMLKSALIALAGVGLMSGAALADPVLPGAGFAWNSSDYWTVTDIGSGQAFFEMRFRNPGAAYDSSFGLYNTDSNGNVTNTLQVFDKFAVDGLFGDTQSVWFQNTGSGWEASLDNATWVSFGNVFGFYSDVYTPESGQNIAWTFYTDTALNSDGQEHFAIAFKQPNFAAIYFEDRYDAGIWNTTDSYDYIVASTDVTPVPEPTTMLLFGSGLLGMAAVARKKTKN